MTQRQGNRVKMMADYTYRPQEKTWHKVFKAGWEGAVTEAEFSAIIEAGAGEDKSRKTVSKAKADKEVEGD